MDKIDIQYGYQITRPEQVIRVWMPPEKWYHRLQRVLTELWDEVIFPAALVALYVICIILDAQP